jgi:putative nucleotidyltransferase with HDIG domain
MRLRARPGVVPDTHARVNLLITATTAAVAAILAVNATEAFDVVWDRPGDFAMFVFLTLALQLFSVEVHGGGRIGVSAIAMLACAFALGPVPAMLLATLAAVTNYVRSRGLLHRAVFDAAQLALAIAGAGFTYHALAAVEGSIAARLVAATVAGFVYVVANNGLLCAAMGLSENVPMLQIWRERFRWARFHYLAYAPLAFASVLAYEAIGVAGLVAFAVPPALILLSVRQYVDYTREANEELTRANAELASKNADLRDLYEFHGGLAANTHDQMALVRYAEGALAQITGTRATIASEPLEGAIALMSGNATVGFLRFGHSATFDGDRWRRLRGTLLPALTTALESAALVEEVKKTHLATIAALSKSMEAKDYYTGGHTERVAEIAVALARRVGFQDRELDAVEIGALLHDIGKIGIPERILQKPGPLDDEEWTVMKSHPIISDDILSQIDFPPVVRQIARSTHERMDGMGYPDGLSGDDVPLAARVVLVADAFDALTTERPYRSAKAVTAALQEIRANTGSQFCPQVVAALEELLRDEPELLGARALRALAS